jgi:hypothetical protein
MMTTSATKAPGENGSFSITTPASTESTTVRLPSAMTLGMGALATA